MSCGPTETFTSVQFGLCSYFLWGAYACARYQMVVAIWAYAAAGRCREMAGGCWDICIIMDVPHTPVASHKPGDQRAEKIQPLRVLRASVRWQDTNSKSACRHSDATADDMWTLYFCAAIANAWNKGNKYALSGKDFLRVFIFSLRSNLLWTGLKCCLMFINWSTLNTVLSVNEYTPFEKYNFKQYLNEHKTHFQNVDKTKFYITSV